MTQGGARPGAGRKPYPPHLRTVSVGYRLPAWLVAWMRDHPWPASKLIVEALIQVHGLKVPMDEK